MCGNVHARQHDGSRSPLVFASLEQRHSLTYSRASADTVVVEGFYTSMYRTTNLHYSRNAGSDPTPHPEIYLVDPQKQFGRLQNSRIYLVDPYLMAGQWFTQLLAKLTSFDCNVITMGINLGG